MHSITQKRRSMRVDGRTESGFGRCLLREFGYRYRCDEQNEHYPSAPRRRRKKGKKKINAEVAVCGAARAMFMFNSKTLEK